MTSNMPNGHIEFTDRDMISGQYWHLIYAMYNKSTAKNNNYEERMETKK